MAHSKKYENLDGLRTLACMGIVLMHVRANGNFSLPGFMFEKLIPSFTNFVFLFMTISGFGMCCGYFDRFINKEIDISDFYKKRYVRILPFFALLSLLDFAISPSLGSLYEVFANLTLCFGLIPNANITVIGVGWFLGVVFAFYLLFPFFCFLLSDKKRAWGAFIVSFIMNYLCIIYFDAGRTSIVYSFVYFVLGGMIFLYKEKLTQLRYVPAISAIILIIAGICYFAIGAYTIIMLIFNAALVIWAISSSIDILAGKPFKLIGSLSFEVFLCHMLVFRVFEKMHLLNMFNNAYLNYIVTSVMVFVGALLFAFVGKKMIAKIFLLLSMKKQQA